METYSIKKKDGFIVIDIFSGNITRPIKIPIIKNRYSDYKKVAEYFIEYFSDYEEEILLKSQAFYHIWKIKIIDINGELIMHEYSNENNGSFSYGVDNAIDMYNYHLKLMDEVGAKLKSITPLDYLLVSKNFYNTRQINEVVLWRFKDGEDEGEEYFTGWLIGEYGIDVGKEGNIFKIHINDIYNVLFPVFSLLVLPNGYEILNETGNWNYYFNGSLLE